MNKTVTIFLAIPHGFAARYLLRSGVFKSLQQAPVHTVVLAPNIEEAYFREEFGSEKVQFERLEVQRSEAYHRRSKLQSFFRQVRVFVLNARHDITTVNDLYRIYQQERNKGGLRRGLYNAAVDVVVWALRKSKGLRRVFLNVESRLFVGHFHRHLFQTYRPALVVTSSLGYFRHDDFLMREAKRHQVPVAAVILSWDNTTSWGMAGAPFDYVIAQTALMKRELITLHDVAPEQIYVEGVAYFDHYHHPEKLEARSTFFERMGLDPKRRLILLATQSPNIFPWNADLIEMIARAICDGRLPQGCQLLVRLHPLHLRHQHGKPVYASLLREYELVKSKYPFVVFNTPQPLSTRLEADMPSSEMADLHSMLRYANVLVNHFSTIAVEACLVDLPTINVGFEPGDLAKLTRLKYSCKVAERRTHNQRVIRAGGVRTVYDEAALIDQIKRYLENPLLDEVGRRRVRQNEAGPHPGIAGIHIGQRLLQVAQRGLK